MLVAPGVGPQARIRFRRTPSRRVIQDQRFPRFQATIQNRPARCI